jgi:hypothetical protein
MCLKFIFQLVLTFSQIIFFREEKQTLAVNPLKDSYIIRIEIYLFSQVFYNTNPKAAKKFCKYEQIAVTLYSH